MTSKRLFGLGAFMALAGLSMVSNQPVLPHGTPADSPIVETQRYQRTYNLERLVGCFQKLGYEVRGEDYLDLRDSMRAAIRKVLLARGVIAESNFHLETYHDPAGNLRLDKSFGIEPSEEVNEVLEKECPAAIVAR